MEQLPIDTLLPEIVRTLRDQPAVLITAPPGAGKTTRVPRALLEAGFAGSGEILVLEPRRLATRLAAARVALELGEVLGETVGYSIRFENADSARTRIRFVTEGVFSRRVLQDPHLRGVSAVILDEFHERHLATDFALAFLRRLQAARPTLRLAVMSATMETEALSAFLNRAPVLSGSQARFEVEIEYERPGAESPRLADKVAAAVSRLLRQRLEGDILVFLPGAAEIRAALDKLTASFSGLLLVPLHGDLPAADQLIAVQPSDRRKIILATNVAETSVTIPGIAAVIDSGLARVAAHSPWNGLPRLTLAKISKASARQRAGRAGRTQSGQVLRLYSRFDFDSRPERDLPEIKRADLTETVLTLHGAGIGDARSFGWFEEPAPSALEAAESLLIRLGALEPDGGLTDTGRRMLRYPVHPRLGRLIIEGERRGAADDAVLLAALLSERDIRADLRSSFRPGAKPKHLQADSDLVELIELYREAEGVRFQRARMTSLGLDRGTLERVERAASQILRLLPRNRSEGAEQDSCEQAVMLAALTAFPDRVAKRAVAGSKTLILSSGGSARLSDTSVVQGAALMIAADAEERTGPRGSSEIQGVVVRLASAVEPEWLVELFPEEVQSEIRLEWNQTGERVEEVHRTSYGQIVLEQTVRAAPRSEATSEMLATHAIARGPSSFRDGDRIEELQARLLLVAKHFPDENFPEIGNSDANDAIRTLCRGKRSLAEISGQSLSEALLGRLTSRQRAVLDRNAPQKTTLHHGRSVRVHYEVSKPPWIESRLQDFFGMTETPAICSGRLPVTIHLLAPNGRPVQVTQDLAGFWLRHYPALKRQLQRRYPKHSWP